MAKKAATTAPVDQPQFAQPAASPDPTKFTVAHGNDNALYKKVQNSLLQAIPSPRPGASLTMNLADTLGPGGAAAVAAIQKSGQIVFHSVGDTGSVSGPATQSLVADKMVADFTDPAPSDRPVFCYHLGDVVYSFGEAQYYYDQFYEPYRSYPAPIFAVPGNHDGLVYTGEGVPSLEAFLRNFVSAQPVKTPESGALIRTAMTQPAVYFTLTAPFVNIIGLYSNVLEDPGVISSQGVKSSPVDDQQLTFLVSALKQAKKAGGATIVVTHHPPYSGGTSHGGSPKMLADIDAACTQANYWPHAHLSGHAHNYQRFTRTVNKYDIPYIVCGNGGHGLSKVAAIAGSPPRTPLNVNADLIFENYDDTDYGYLRIVVNATQMRIELHDAQVGQVFKSPSDAVTVDLASHTMVAN
jgi:Calcineurin-like phosphoesterase/Iron/zinc purple acid phosphatase-like protein C